MEKATVSARQSAHESIRDFPRTSGVYIMKNAEGSVLYVGKAKNLRNRVRSYFNRDKDAKTSVLMSKVDHIDYIVCRNEYEALLLENNLIKEHTPRYNINLKDGKTYPVIRITNEEYPRVFRTRHVIEDGSVYFGPFPNVHGLDRYLELIEKLFPLRKCRRPVQKKPHPCLYYHIGRCAAVCAGKTEHDEYMERVEGIKMLLSGKTDELIQDLQRQMAEAVENLKFERAADLRDTISAIETTHAEQEVVGFETDVADYLGYHERDGMVSFTVFHMRAGKMLGSEAFHSEVVSEPEEFIPQFLLQYYTSSAVVPEKLVVGERPPVIKVFADSLVSLLQDRFGKSPDVQSPVNSRDQSIIQLAEENARRDFDKRQREEGNIPALEELQALLRLPRLPLRIEGFDIAHVDGKHPVASMVSFLNGRPDKKNYRKFHMKTLDGKIDDFAAMREVVARRYSRVQNEELPAPDLILIDGGKGQVSAATSILAALDMDLPVVGLAKREEEVFLPGEPEPIRLPDGSEPLRVLQAVRDEAHRFATKFRAGLQSGDLRLGTLNAVSGIGPARSRKLMERFESLARIAETDPGTIAAEVGIPLETASAVQQAARSAAVSEDGTTPT